MTILKVKSATEKNYKTDRSQTIS